MLTSSIQPQIENAVDRLFDQQVAFLRDLVKIPSLRGQEAPCQDLVAATLRRMGYAVDQWQLDVADLQHHPGFSPVMYTSYERAYNVVRIGIYPEWEVATCQQEIETTIREAAAQDPVLVANPPAVRWHGFLSPGYILPEKTEVETALAHAHQLVYGGPLLPHKGTALTDSRFYGLYQNTPALVYGAITKNSHSFDEAVDLESLRRVTKVVALFIAGWCGLETRSA